LIKKSAGAPLPTLPHIFPISPIIAVEKSKAMKYLSFFLLLCLFLFPACGDDDVSLEDDVEKIEEYLTENGLAAQSTESGLHYIIEEEGEGDFYAPGDELTVFYTGYFLDDEIFDQTALYPATFPLNNLIAGWQEGLQLFKPGGKGMLLLPSSLGYGANPPNGIPKNAVLIFEIETVADLPALEQARIGEYLMENGLTADTTSSGLHYIIEDEGTGDNPTANATVTINYQGSFINGAIFDATNISPAQINLQNVIPGWREGIPLFKRGGVGTIILPSALGYGISPPQGIPQNAILIFEVELIDF
jgi:FKBP-type peptidyl-prolyl cis-trans isomerase